MEQSLRLLTEHDNDHSAPRRVADTPAGRLRIGHQLVALCRHEVDRAGGDPEALAVAARALEPVRERLAAYGLGDLDPFTTRGRV